MTRKVTLEKTEKRLQWSAGPWAEPKLLYIGIACAIAVLLPWLITRLDGGGFILHLVILFFGWGIVVQCWNLIMGVSGIYSFGQVALFAIGGWTTAVLATHLGWTPWVSIWFAPVTAAIASLIIGIPTLRLRGHICGIINARLSRTATQLYDYRAKVYQRWWIWTERRAETRL